MSEPDLETFLSVLKERVVELDRISEENLAVEYADPVIRKRKRENLLSINRDVL